MDVGVPSITPKEPGIRVELSTFRNSNGASSEGILEPV
jgi:hypothetical protein